MASFGKSYFVVKPIPMPNVRFARSLERIRLDIAVTERRMAIVVWAQEPNFDLKRPELVVFTGGGLAHLEKLDPTIV